MRNVRQWMLIACATTVLVAGCSNKTIEAPDKSNFKAASTANLKGDTGGKTETLPPPPTK